MLLVTDKGHYFTVVEDFADPTVLWVRSQDKASIQHVREVLAHVGPGPVPELVDEPTWDYRFRVRLSRQEWIDYQINATQELSCHKLKPAVAEARGAGHPVSRMVEEVFYFMSYNRPDRSKPGWITGKPRRKARA